MNTLLIHQARNFAFAHHLGVFRKHMEPPQPYFTHPEAVATRASFLGFSEPTRSTIIAAAFLHDCAEDENALGQMVEPDYIEACIWAGSVTTQAIDLVKELTNFSKAYPELSRETRKQMDREHIAKVAQDDRPNA